MLVFKVQWMKVMEMYMAILMADLFESWISVQWFDTEIRVEAKVSMKFPEIPFELKQPLITWQWQQMQLNLNLSELGGVSYIFDFDFTFSYC